MSDTQHSVFFFLFLTLSSKVLTLTRTSPNYTSSYLVVEGHLGPELPLGRRQLLLGLRVEGGILDEAVHKDHQMRLDLVRFARRPRLHLALHALLEALCDHVRDVVNVAAALNGADRVYETHLGGC